MKERTVNGLKSALVYIGCSFIMGISGFLIVFAVWVTIETTGSTADPHQGWVKVGHNTDLQYTCDGKNLIYRNGGVVLRDPRCGER